MTLEYVRDIAVRAGWTGVQAGLGVVVAAGTGWVDADLWQAAGIVAVAATLAAVKTAISYNYTPTPH